MGSELNYSGFIIAVLAFLLTRFTVTLALEDPLQFYFAGVIPLVVGLGLAAFGVALAVGDLDPAMVRTTTRWCLLGFTSMLVLVVLTLLGSPAGGTLDVTTIRSQTHLSNFLIGGSVGGTLTGLYAARTRRQRSALSAQTNRLVTLNRLLRHEVLNAVMIIRGYVTTDAIETSDRLSAIDESAERIQQTIEQVKYLTDRADTAQSSRTPRRLGAALTESVETIGERHPAATVSRPSVPEELAVAANERLPLVFTHLLDNAIVHGADDTPSIDVEATPMTVEVSVSDAGAGLSENQRLLLETGDIQEFDDPGAGFGLNIVRLLVESYGGSIATEVSDDGTTVTVRLPRAARTGEEGGPNRAALSGVQPAVPHLLVAGGAALVSGVLYGVVSELLGGSVAGIGIFYGTVDPIVGWLTHEFHSVVFAFMYVGLLSTVVDRFRSSIGLYAVSGVVWGFVVWVVAASFVAPVWLQLVGVPTSVPSFSLRLLANHLAWGASLGVLTWGGYQYVTPWLAALSD
jgi:signal transduction histidine kinase